MRVAGWNPKLHDDDIMNSAMERISKIAELVAAGARQRVSIGVSRPPYKTGKDYTAREAGALRDSIRVVKLFGSTKLNVRIYAGSHKVYYARFVEMGTSKMRARPFMRPALSAAKVEAKNILENVG